MAKLVSVAVISYNSSKTILQTLESVKSQSYDSSNIELIISDDGSIDNTCDVINQWLEKNRSLFCAVKTNLSKKNKGVSANCNITFSLCSGEWVKIIAADDLLVKSCIEDNINRANNTSCKVIFSLMQAFSEDKLLDSVFPLQNQRDIFNSNDRINQLTKIRKHGGFKSAPTQFLHKSVFPKLGLLDENFSLIEDYPMWIRLSKYYKFDFFESITVLYRVEESISNSRKKICNQSYIRQKLVIDKKQFHDEKNIFCKLVVIARVRDNYVILFMSSLLGNKKTSFSDCLISFFSNFSLIKQVGRVAKKYV